MRVAANVITLTKPSYSPKSYVKNHVYVHYICDFSLGRLQYAIRDYTQMEEQCRTEKDGQQMEGVQKLTIFQLLLQIHSMNRLRSQRSILCPAGRPSASASAMRYLRISHALIFPMQRQRASPAPHYTHTNA